PRERASAGGGSRVPRDAREVSARRAAAVRVEGEPARAASRRGGCTGGGAVREGVGGRDRRAQAGRPVAIFTRRRTKSRGSSLQSRTPVTTYRMGPFGTTASNGQHVTSATTDSS